MTKSKLLFTFLIITSSLIAYQPSNTGIGIMVGEPTGWNGKLWLDNHNALVGGLGWHFVGPGDGISIHLDYLYHIDNKFNTNITFPLYYGFGSRIRSEDGKFGLGFRGIGGVHFFLDPEPIDVFFEVVPVFNLLPSTDLELDVAIGARYYF